MGSERSLASTRAQTSRRGLLGAVGSAGGLGAAGCLDGGSEPTPAAQPSESADAITDPSTPAAASTVDEPDLFNGYVIGQAPGETVVVDPRNHSSDAQAIQAAHDQLGTLLDTSVAKTGIVWIPALKPDGTEFVIDDTVTFEWGDSTARGIYPRGWGFWGRSSPAIQLDIDDGSPAFELRNMKGQGGEIGGLRFEGLHGGEDCEALRLHGMIAFFYNKIEIRGIGGPQQNGAITIDGRCFNSYFNNCRYNSWNEDVTDGSFFAFRDLEDMEGPGELKFGDGNSTYADPQYPYGHAFDFDGSFSVSPPDDVLIRGRYEGYGKHCIYGTEGTVYLGDGLEIGRPQDPDGTGTSRVHWEGWKIHISDGVTMVSAGNTGGAPAAYVHATRGRIWPFSLSDDSVTALQIPEDKGANRMVIPRPETFPQSVNYPETFYNQLVYPDGFRRIDQGTVTLSSDGTDAQLVDWIQADMLRINTCITSDPGTDVRYTVQKGYSSGNKQTAWIVDQTDDGSSDYQVEYEIEVKG